jgi:hypothetical protein
VTAALPARWPAWTIGALAAVPVLAVGLLLLFSPLQVRGADGGSVACGRPVAPATDQFAGGLCSDVPYARLGDGVALVVAALVLAVGVPWTLGSGPGRFGRRPRPDGADPGPPVLDRPDAPGMPAAADGACAHQADAP